MGVSEGGAGFVGLPDDAAGGVLLGGVVASLAASLLPQPDKAAAIRARRRILFMVWIAGMKRETVLTLLAVPQPGA